MGPLARGSDEDLARLSARVCELQRLLLNLKPVSVRYRSAAIAMTGRMNYTAPSTVDMNDTSLDISKHAALPCSRLGRSVGEAMTTGWRGQLARAQAQRYTSFLVADILAVRDEPRRSQRRLAINGDTDTDDDENVEPQNGGCWQACDYISYDY